MRRVTVFRIDDKSKVLEYPLARLQNFSSDPRCLILKEGGQEFTFGTRVGAEVCGILKDVSPKAPVRLTARLSLWLRVQYAMWEVEERKRRSRKPKAADAKEAKPEEGKPAAAKPEGEPPKKEKEKEKKPKKKPAKKKSASKKPA